MDPECYNPNQSHFHPPGPDYEDTDNDGDNHRSRSTQNPSQSPPLPPYLPSGITVYEVIKPFYILSKLVGFSWFTLCGYKWRWAQYFDPIVFLLNVALRLLHLYGTVMMTLAPAYSPITGTLRLTFLAITSGLPLVHILLSVLHRTTQCQVIARLHRFDQQIVASFNVSVAHLRHRKYVQIYMAFVLVVVPLLICSTCALCFYNDLRLTRRFILPMMLSSGISLVNYTISFSHIVLATLAILVRLRALNAIAAKTLVDVVIESGPSAVSLGNGRQRGDRVRQLRILYGILVEAVDGINNSFAFIGLACTLVCFVVLISSTFANYEAVISSGDSDWRTATSFLLINVVWCSSYNAFLISTVSISAGIKEQVSSLQFISRDKSSSAAAASCSLAKDDHGSESMREMVFCRYNY